MGCGVMVCDNVKNKIFIFAGILFFSLCMCARDRLQDIFSLRSAADVVPLFPQTVDAAEALVARAIEQGRASLPDVVACGRHSVEQAAAAFDDVHSAITSMERILGVINLTYSDNSLRSAAKQGRRKLKNFLCECAEYAPLKAIFLDGDTQRLCAAGVNKKYAHFLHNFFCKKQKDMSFDDCQRMRELRQIFRANIAHDTQCCFLSRGQLQGVTRYLIDELPVGSDGMVQVGFHSRVIDTLLCEGECEEARKAAWKFLNARAYPANSDVLHSLAVMRQEIARREGDTNSLHYALRQRCIKNSAEAYDFLDKMVRSLTPFYGTWASKISPWNWKYVMEKLRYDVGWYPGTKVDRDTAIERACVCYARIFGLSAKKESAHGLWADGVQVYGFYHKNKCRGYVVIDPISREGKFTRSCHVSVIPAVLKKTKRGSQQKSLSIVITHMSPRPTFKEIRSLVHELCHALHGSVGIASYAVFSGTRESRDFAETIATLGEWLLYVPQVAQSLGYCSGKAVNFLDKVAKIDYLANMYSALPRAYFALLSFEPKWLDRREALKKHIHTIKVPFSSGYFFEDHFETSFTHMVGIGPGFFGYLYVRLIALSVAQRMQSNGVFASGKQFVRQVLENKNNDDPWQRLEKFLDDKIMLDGLLKNLEKFFGAAPIFPHAPIIIQPRASIIE